MTAFLTAIQFLCTAVGFLVLFIVFAACFFIAWGLISMSISARRIAKEEHNRFRAELRTRYNGLSQEDFDRVYRQFWEDQEKFKQGQ